MFAFALTTNDEFSFVQTSDGAVYTYPAEEEAKSYFNCVRHHASLYQIDDDLSTARLVELGDIVSSDIPLEVSLTNEQKTNLWNSYRYKSLLTWNPEPEDITP
jgi:hypothetical protein